MLSPSQFAVPEDRPHFAVWPKRLPRALVVPETSLWFNLEVAATRFPNRAAYTFFGRALTYRDLRSQAEALAGWLQSKGVQAGDRVAIFMQNCPQFPVALYAVLRANAVVVPVNPMNKAEEFKHYIVDPDTKVVICSADLAAIVDAANSALPEAQRAAHVLVTRYTDAMPEGAVDPGDAPSAAMDAWLRSDTPLPAGATRWQEAIAEARVPGPHTARPDDLALLPYTSGTTGLPKGCMHTHRTLMHNAVAGQWTFAGAPEPVVLGVVPMFHITGMLYSVLGSVHTGASVVLMPRWDRELAGRLISNYRISHWTCIPTMVIDLFGSPNYKSFDLSSLRTLSGGGAAMPYAVAERLQAEFGLAFIEGYGLTETAAPSHSNPPEGPKLQCLGIPIFSVDSRVVDPVTLQRAAGRRSGRDHHARADGLHRLLEASGSDRGGVRRVRWPLVLSHRRPRPHGRARLLLHDRSPQAHDQCERLQGLAGGGGDAALQAPGGAGGLHHRRTRRLSRRDGEGGGGAARSGQGQDQRRRDHRLGQGQHGGVQGTEGGAVRRRAAEVGLGQGDVAAAAGPGRCLTSSGSGSGSEAREASASRR